MQLWHSPFFDGGVEKTRLCLFILLSSEKNEPRGSGSYRAIRLVATVAVGVCGTRSARTVLALFPPSPLRLHRPIKADRGLWAVPSGRGRRCCGPADSAVLPPSGRGNRCGMNCDLLFRGKLAIINPFQPHSSPNGMT